MGYDLAGPRLPIRSASGCILAVSTLLAGCGGVQSQAIEHEIWAMDQGTNLIHVFDGDLNEIGRIDMESHGARVPHMIDFTSNYAFAFVANPATGNVAVIRAADREVIAVIPTGPRTHAVTVAPGDRTALVAVIGSPDQPFDGKLVELTLDLENESFSVARELVIADDPLFAPRRDEFVETGGAVCQDFTDDGRYAYVSLGPAVEEGGLVVLDTHEFGLVKIFAPQELQANCGTLASPTGQHMFVNAGNEQVGTWHVLETATHTPVHRDGSRGHDAHGVWLTPDGSELWMVNRSTSNAIVVDPGSFEVLEEIEFVGKTPDIIAMSPDGRYAYISLRGPNPVTMPHLAVGDTPGMAIIDVATRELVRIVEPAQGNERSDFHGIAVRPLP